MQAAMVKWPPKDVAQVIYILILQCPDLNPKFQLQKDYNLYSYWMNSNI